MRAPTSRCGFPPCATTRRPTPRAPPSTGSTRRRSGCAGLQDLPPITPRAHWPPSPTPTAWPCAGRAESRATFCRAGAARGCRKGTGWPRRDCSSSPIPTARSPRPPSGSPPRSRRPSCARCSRTGSKRSRPPNGPRARAGCGRAELARAAGADMPAMDEASLLAEAEDWLLPFLGSLRSAADWSAFDIHDALRARLGWAGLETVERIAPGSWRTPLGREVPVDYEGDVPGVAVRLQEVFGLTRHPQVAGQPLRLTLLSPAGRPVQVTTDLPGFWASSYADVRKDMRGRYPRHPWPEDPETYSPTLRAKPRGS